MIQLVPLCLLAADSLGCMFFFSSVVDVAPVVASGVVGSSRRLSSDVPLPCCYAHFLVFCEMVLSFCLCFCTFVLPVLWVLVLVLISLSAVLGRPVPLPLPLGPSILLLFFSNVSGSCSSFCLFRCPGAAVSVGLVRSAFRSFLLFFFFVPSIFLFVF